MKLKLKDINPNPFKKHINKGKLSEDTISKIISNMKELGLMGALPIFKRKEKYYLIAGHHRVEALKRVFGKDFQVEVTVHNYNDDQVMRGMVVENLTQRDSDLRETAENLAAIRDYLQKGSDSEHFKNKHTGKGGRGNEESGSIRHIHEWLHSARKNEIIPIGRISECLQVFDKLSPELIDQVKKTQASSAVERDEALQETQAVYLARFDDHAEQKALAKALKVSREQRVRDQGKLITQYKEAKKANPEVAKEVLAGKRDLADVGLADMPRLLNPQAAAYEHVTKMQEFLTWFENDIPSLKKNFKNLSTKELTTFLLFMRSWGIKAFAPLHKYISEEIYERGEKDGKVKKGNFIFTDDDMKGGV